MVLSSTSIERRRGLPTRIGIAPPRRDSLCEIPEGEAFTCVVCGKAFTSYRGLRIHEGKLRHQLTDGTSQVGQNTTLDMIQRTHSGEEGADPAGQGVPVGEVRSQTPHRLREHVRELAYTRWSVEESRQLAMLDYHDAKRTKTRGRGPRLFRLMSELGCERTCVAVCSRLREPSYLKVREELWDRLRRKELETEAGGETRGLTSQLVPVNRETLTPARQAARVIPQAPVPNEIGVVHRGVQLRECHVRLVRFDECHVRLVRIDANHEAEAAAPSPPRIIQPHVLVRRLDIPEGVTRVPLSCDGSPVADPIIGMIRQLAGVRKRKVSAPMRELELQEILKLACVCSKEVLHEKLNGYFESIFPGSGVGRPKNASGKGARRRRKFRDAYEHFRTQDLWRKNRSRTARDILRGRTGSQASPTTIPGFFDHWASTFEFKAVDLSAYDWKVAESDVKVWYPVEEEELVGVLRGMDAGTSPGLDGFPVADLKCVHTHILLAWCNLILYLGRVPDCFMKSKTVFIPKVDEPKVPSDYRPISMTSAILRLLNKILAKRLIAECKFDERQRGFLPTDGCAENVCLLDALLNEASRRKRSVIIALLDMKNAYGSVAHAAVFKALEAKKVDTGMLRYVMSLYNGFRTVLSARGLSREVVVEQGILQGDPLSPILFNMVVDQLLAVIPEEVGFDLVHEEVTVNGGAFADDLMLVSQGVSGMKSSLRAVEKAAAPLGLVFNPKKCSILAKRHISKKGGGSTYEVLDDRYTFEVGGGNIPVNEEVDRFRYLGAYFNYRGLTQVKCELELFLTRLQKASLSISQKLYVLRVHLIPKLIHRLVFGGETSGKYWEQLDGVIRKYVRQMLRLPRGSPNDFFYANVADGGLGIMCLRRSIPAMRLRRFEALQNSSSPAIKAAAFSHSNAARIAAAGKLLVSVDDIVGDSREKIQQVNSTKLYKSVDGGALKQAAFAPYVHRWLAAGTFGSGLADNRTLCRAIRVRINGLATKSRVYRGYAHDRSCRAGCGRAETNEHVMQSCGFTREDRRARHNRVVEVLQQGLSKAEFQLPTIPPSIEVSPGRHVYPDVVAVKDSVAYVIDVHIIGDQVNMAEAYKQKVCKYRDMPGFAEALRKQHAVSVVSYGAVVISRRGIVAPHTEQFREESLYLPKKYMSRMVRETILGSIRIYDHFVKRQKPFHFFPSAKKWTP